MKTPKERRAFWEADLDRCRRALAQATGDDRRLWGEAISATRHLRDCPYRHSLPHDGRPLCAPFGHLAKNSANSEKGLDKSVEDRVELT